MDNATQYVGLIIGGIILLFFYMKYMDKKNKTLFISKMKREWGKVPNREYTFDKLESIAGYFEYKKYNEEFYIDDITWHDLDMDRIYAKINNSNSSLGDEYLYYMLRTPKFDDKILNKRRKLIDYIADNEEFRLKLQIIFGKIGRPVGLSINQYVHSLSELKKDNNMFHYASAIFAIVAIIMLFVAPQLGIVLILVAFVANVSNYLKRKREIEPYFMSVIYIVRLLKCAEFFLCIDDELLAECQEVIRNVNKSLAKVKRGAKWLKAGQNTSSIEGALIDTVLDYLRMIFHIDLIKFNDIVDTVSENVEEIDKLFDALGEVEAAIAIASYREQVGKWSYPILEKKDNPFMEVEDVYHPLIDNPVTNNIKEEKCVLITGSNASGKSTFLKTIAINSILAQTINMVTASKYRSAYFRTYSSMALSDSILDNESYYIVEIKSLKRIIDAGKKENLPCVLCFVDEVLRGTNTVERIAASAQILKDMSEENILTFAATHDIELTHILEKKYANYHFTEEVSNDDVIFNYKLNKGRAVSRNAIKLLGIMGYDKRIIDSANEMAREFIESNSWRTV